MSCLEGAFKLQETFSRIISLVSPFRPLLVRGDPAARASLIDWFGQMLGTSLESDSVNVSSVRVSKSWAQRSAADAAMKDVRAANLMLVVLFTASFVMATLVASCFAV